MRLRRRAGRPRPRRQGGQGPGAAVPRRPRARSRPAASRACSGSRSLRTTRRASQFVIDYTDRNGDTRVVALPLERHEGAARRARTQLLFVDQPYPNHNGGMVAYGSDGLLYVGMGDGGSGGDPENRAQNPSSLLGKILRLDPARPGTKPVIVARRRPQPVALLVRPRERRPLDRRRRPGRRSRRSTTSPGRGRGC